MRLGCQYLPGTNSSLLQNTVTVIWHWSLFALVFTVFTGQRERRGGRKIKKEGGNLSWIVIFHERSIRNRHKNFSPLRYTDGWGACVCLFVCLNVCLSVFLSFCLSVCLVCLYVWMSVCLSFCLSVYLSVCLFVCLPCVKMLITFEGMKGCF